MYHDPCRTDVPKQHTNLPKEVLLLVLSKLEAVYEGISRSHELVEDLCSASLVCAEWLAVVIAADDIWEGIYKTRFEPVIDPDQGSSLLTWRAKCM